MLCHEPGYNLASNWASYPVPPKTVMEYGRLKLVPHLYIYIDIDIFIYLFITTTNEGLLILSEHYRKNSTFGL